MRVPWQLRVPITLVAPRRTTMVARAQLASSGLDDRATARLDRGFVRADPELLHTFLRVGAKPTVRR